MKNKNILTDIEDKSLDDQIRYNFYVAMFRILGIFEADNVRRPIKNQRSHKRHDTNSVARLVY